MTPNPISPVTLPGTELHRLRANGIDQEFELRVALPVPGLMRPLPDRYDTLYVLDGDLFFGTAVEMTRRMSMLFGELPPPMSEPWQNGSPHAATPCSRSTIRCSMASLILRSYRLC